MDFPFGAEFSMLPDSANRIVSAFPFRMDPVQTTRPSLRRHFAWTVSGNVVQGASQWAILSAIAKLGSAEMLGQYALFMAIALPVAMLAHLNLRAVLATDVQEAHPFGDYLTVRLLASAAGLAMMLIAGLSAGLRGQSLAAMLLVGAALTFEAVSDLYYGWMQHRDRMDVIARSMILRGVIAAGAVAVAVAVFRSVLAAALAFALARAATLAAYDLPRSGAPAARRREPLPVFRYALPLGFVLMLTSLTANLPRYAIERHLGTRELGAFAAVASFVTIGTTLVNALGQSATTRLSRHFSAGDHRAFLRLVTQLAGFAALLGALGVAMAALAGEFFLTLIYRPEYAVYKGALVEILGAGAFLYLAVVLGYALTSTRTFGPQIPLLCAVAAACGLTSLAAVPVFGLSGAALAIGIAACVQIAGQLFLLRRAL
jgi:O-antigen/teichoic acid export membrane protein